MSRIKFMNTEIDNLTMSEALSAIDDLIQAKQNSYVVTPNVDHIVKLESHKRLQESYANASLILTDGMPLVWASKFFGTPIKEKISGSDLFPLLCQRSVEKNYSMFFLGAKNGVAEKAAENLRKTYPGLNVVGCYAPPFGFERDPAEMSKIHDLLKNSKPDILILALGCPKQEIFAFEQREVLGVPVSLGLGASLDFAAGNVKRAPRWMANAGLEWLFRLIQEPRRMFKRYILEDMMFIKLLWKYRKQ